MNPEPSELPILYPWDQGGKVMELQELLRAHGFEVRLNGDFDRFTEAAVKAYQHQQGLRIDGVVGEKTWMALTSSVQPGTRSLRCGCWGADVCELQGLLLVHGYNIARSRMFEDETEAAVRDFQERSRLRVTGVVDATTWTFLRGRGLSTPPPKQNRWIMNPRKWW
ncbi:peptidoglycan-binding domain-containing protein [Leptolyngbya sp. AN03gr2]|uniref:peptidoglycan-binding domain-containing protein n=1 Tax=unclassified Leptolyngbya TaxID=2650499 RepID=UPI003D3147BF